MDWYYARGDVRFGPFGDQAIREMAASGELLPGDLVWHTGIGEWKTAATVSGLFVPPRIPSIAPPITAGGQTIASSPAVPREIVLPGGGSVAASGDQTSPRKTDDLGSEGAPEARETPNSSLVLRLIGIRGSIGRLHYVLSIALALVPVWLFMEMTCPHLCIHIQS